MNSYIALWAKFTGKMLFDKDIAKSQTIELLGSINNALTTILHGLELDIDALEYRIQVNNCLRL